MKDHSTAVILCLLAMRMQPCLHGDLIIKYLPGKDHDNNPAHLQ